RSVKGVLRLTHLRKTFGRPTPAFPLQLASSGRASRARHRRLAMTGEWIRGTIGGALAAAVIAAFAGASGAQGAPSDKPDNPFKLATFETGGKGRVGLVLARGR